MNIFIAFQSNKYVHICYIGEIFIMIYKGNRTNYGETIGILMMDSHFPRIPGDIGNATTFPFPVRYEIVKGADIANVVTSQSSEILDRMIQGAKKLESEGVRAITGSCGFLAIWQKEIAAQVNIPVFTSSLLQVPLAHTITGGKPVGVVTALAKNLTNKHLQAVNASNIPIVIYGLDQAKEFNKTFTYNGETLDYNAVSNEVTEAVKDMLANNPDIGSIVLECSNIPPYASRISEMTGLPVFDLTTLVKFVHSVVIREEFKGYL